METPEVDRPVNPRPPLPRRPKPVLLPNPSSNIRGDDVILLSFFDGIGTACFALTSLIGPPSLVVSWELDPECILISQKHFPSMVHRGDFLAETVAAVQELVDQADPQRKKLIVLVGPRHAPTSAPFGPMLRGYPVLRDRNSVNMPGSLLSWNPCCNHALFCLLLRM